MGLLVGLLGAAMGFGGALTSWEGAVSGGGVAGGYWCLVPVSAWCVAGQCTLFLSDPSMQHGRELALPCRRPETSAVKDCVKCPCGAWGCGRRCWKFGLGLALLSWAVPAQCQFQSCCEPRSLLPGCRPQALGWGALMPQTRLS